MTAVEGVASVTTKESLDDESGVRAGGCGRRSGNNGDAVPLAVVASCPVTAGCVWLDSTVVEEMRASGTTPWS